MSGVVFKNSFIKIGNVSTQAQTLSSFSRVSGETSLGALSSDITSTNATEINRALGLAGGRPIPSVIIGALTSPDVARIPLPLIPIPIFPIFTDPFSPLAPLRNGVDDRLFREARPDARFSAYEELTGISKTRPEVILVTNFEPLFDARPVNATFGKQTTFFDANAIGQFIDAQIQMQHLRHEAIVKLIADMKSDKAASVFLDQKESDFRNHLLEVSNYVQTLYDVVAELDTLRQKLSVKSLEFASYNDIALPFFSDVFSRPGGLLHQPAFSKDAMQNMSLANVLRDMGFSATNVAKFSSTKVFLQSIYELSNILRRNSYHILNGNSFALQADANPTFVFKHDSQNFSFDPEFLAPPSRDTLALLDGGNVFFAIDDIKDVYDNMFKEASFLTDESRLAFLFNFLSREFTFSAGLASEYTQTFLSREFGYEVKNDQSNESMIDVIFGAVGAKITDRTDVHSVNSLSALAQKRVGNSAVLTFEPDYIEHDWSVFTPGSSYFLDGALDVSSLGFNTERLKAFSSEVQGHLQRFTTVAKQFRFLPVEKRVSIQGEAKLGYADHLTHGRLLFDTTMKSFLTREFDPIPAVASADCAAVFTAAFKDTQLRSLLFVYMYLKVFGGNSKTTNQALESVLREINGYVSTRQPTVGVHKNFLTPMGGKVIAEKAITTELRQLNEFLHKMFRHFREIFSAFETSSAIKNHRTRFSGISDIALLMIIFDIIVGLVATFAPKTLVGKLSTLSSQTVGVSHYNVQQRDPSFVRQKNRLSSNLIRSLLDYEVDTVAKFTFCITSMLSQVKNAFDAAVGTLQRETVVKQINEISQIVGSSKNLSLVLNAQQVFLMKAALADIFDKLRADLSLPKAPGNVDFELHGPGRDDIALLGDVTFSPAFKNTFLAFFSNEKLASKKGSNIRLLSVGIPFGLSQKFREYVQFSKISNETISQKQADIVRINVFKVDIEHQDIVFRPQSFLFELSRFVSRAGEVTEVSPTATPDQVLAAVPLRDFSFGSSPTLRNYYTFSSENALGYEIASQYNFLTGEQKRELLKNHIQSFFYETYIKLLTGISVSEFDLVADVSSANVSPASQDVINEAVANIIRKTTRSTSVPSNVDLLFLGPNGAAATNVTQGNSQFLEASDQAGTLNEAMYNNFVAGMRVAQDVKESRTVYSNKHAEARRLFLPKAFDRVFTVAVDPDDFEINIDETLKTVAGKESFRKLLTQGVIIDVATQSSFYGNAATGGTYRIREKDKNENDITFEKYFVTIETVSNEVV